MQSRNRVNCRGKSPFLSFQIGEEIPNLTADFGREQKLELLIGSRSLASTVTTLFSLSSMGIFEISLIIIWALSPIAGQASVRVLSLRQFNATILLETSWLATNIITSVATIDDVDQVLELKSRYISFLLDAKSHALEPSLGYVG
jgi:hypothetical protein